MSTKISTPAAAARDAARQGDGKFGQQQHAESGVDLATQTNDLVLPTIETRERVFSGEEALAQAHRDGDTETVMQASAALRSAQILHAMTEDGRAELRDWQVDLGVIAAGERQRRYTDLAAGRGIGFNTQPVSIAEVRRSLPVESKVEVVYLNGPSYGLPAGVDRDKRTVVAQSDNGMATTRDTVEDADPVSNYWHKTSAVRDDQGNYIVSDQTGLPYVAYCPAQD
jgi:hypothetical protein